MAKIKSELLSVFGIVFQIVKALIDEMKNLGGSDDDLRKIETDGSLRRKIAGLITDQTTPVLKFLRKVSVPAVARFVAADHFVEDISENAGVCIKRLNNSFKESFLGIVEKNVREAEFSIHYIEYDSLDSDVAMELGDSRETSLAHLFMLLKAQRDGEQGPLHTSFMRNIFYIRDVDGCLLTVSAAFDLQGWCVTAVPFEIEAGWSGGNQVLSRS